MPWWPHIPNVSEYTRPATWEDVKNLARLLNEAGVRWKDGGRNGSRRRIDPVLD
jgi:hypothetical protein